MLHALTEKLLGWEVVVTVKPDIARLQGEEQELVLFIRNPSNYLNLNRNPCLFKGFLLLPKLY